MENNDSMINLVSLREYLHDAIRETRMLRAALNEKGDAKDLLIQRLVDELFDALGVRGIVGAMNNRAMNAAMAMGYYPSKVDRNELYHPYTWSVVKYDGDPLKSGMYLVRSSEGVYGVAYYRTYDMRGYDETAPWSQVPPAPDPTRDIHSWIQIPHRPIMPFWSAQLNKQP